jgi:hypothetical protein
MESCGGLPLFPGAFVHNRQHPRYWRALQHRRGFESRRLHAPALYCAEDYSTAFLEKFGSRETGIEGLTGAELALRTPTSFTQVRLQLQLENVLDVSDQGALKSIVDILKDLQMPKSVPQTARKLGLKQAPWLVRSTITLQRQLLHPNWRMLPMQFDLPANSQIFGRLVAAAGVHGILYQSARDSTHRCLALYPQNWSGSSSFLALVDSTARRGTSDSTGWHNHPLRIGPIMTVDVSLTGCIYEGLDRRQGDVASVTLHAEDNRPELPLYSRKSRSNFAAN